MDLICFSHIRWNFVYQRPQHLLTRFACYHRTFVIEEPILTDATNYYEVIEKKEDNLSIVLLHVSRQLPVEQKNQTLKALIDSFFHSETIHNYMLWYYTPMALAYSDHLYPKLIIYDCMDELSAFKFAPPEIKKCEAQLLRMADLVFTGGQSLYTAKKHLHHNIHPFPSSIDKAHFASARVNGEEPTDQENIPHPRIGFYGVIDERLHIDLIDKIAEAKPDWHFVLIGPVIKIDPAILPRKNNIHYLGGKDYKQLPHYLSGWDIAMLPFVLDESTRYISPTKTPEYLAGGKPVISTSISDVVDPYQTEGLVHIADTSKEFIKEAEIIFSNSDKTQWLNKVDSFLAHMSWNNTWHKMNDLIQKALLRKSVLKIHKTKSYV